MTIEKSSEPHPPWKLARYAASFLLNCVLASVLTNALTAPFEPRLSTIRTQTSRAISQIELSSAVLALVLGAYVSWRWKWLSATARYIWVAGLLWLARGVSESLKLQTSSALYGQDLIHTAYSLISGAGCTHDVRNCLAWADYPLQSWRTIFYSVGAVCAAVYISIRNRRGA